MAIKSKDKIYFDTDCISSFLWGNQEALLVTLYGNRMVIPSMVYGELKKVTYLFNKINVMQSKGLCPTESFSFVSEEFKIYLLLKTGDSTHPLIDDGEAAVIALAKCNEATMASNNLKDVGYYIDFYKLNNITTADILFEAYEKDLLILAEIEKIWRDMRAHKRKLPYDTFSQWLTANKKTTK